MTRCECHQVEFSTVARYAQKHGVWDFEVLCRRAQCGDICTACHCDLRQYLALARSGGRGVAGRQAVR
jgi:bacterioferritin-associated ferredoxin